MMGWEGKKGKRRGRGTLKVQLNGTRDANVWDNRAKPKSLFATTSSKNLGSGGAMFGEKIAGTAEKKAGGVMDGQ